MAILRAITSIADLDWSNGNFLMTDADVDYYGANVSEAIWYEGLGTGFANGYVEFDDQTDVWVSMDVFRGAWEGDGTSTMTNAAVALVDSASGKTVVEIGRNKEGSFNQINFRYRNNSDTLVRQSVASARNALARWDLHLKIHPTEGAIELYINTVLMHTFAVNSAGLIAGSVDRLQLATPNSASGSNQGLSAYSGVIVANEDTREMGFIQRKPTTDGALTQWEGTYADIDENQYDDATFTSGMAIGDRSSYTKAALPTLGEGIGVAAVVHSIRARRFVPGIGRIATFVREGGTNHDSALQAPGDEFSNLYFIHSTNPDTGQPYTVDEINTSELGLLANV